MDYQIIETISLLTGVVTSHISQKSKLERSRKTVLEDMLFNNHIKKGVEEDYLEKFKEVYKNANYFEKFLSYFSILNYLTFSVTYFDPNDFSTILGAVGYPLVIEASMNLAAFTGTFKKVVEDDLVTIEKKVYGLSDNDYLKKAENYFEKLNLKDKKKEDPSDKILNSLKNFDLDRNYRYKDYV